jgi:hypothetical protein
VGPGKIIAAKARLFAGEIVIIAAKRKAISEVPKTDLDVFLVWVSTVSRDIVLIRILNACSFVCHLDSTILLSLSGIGRPACRQAGKPSPLGKDLV